MSARCKPVIRAAAGVTSPPAFAVLGGTRSHRRSAVPPRVRLAASRNAVLAVALGAALGSGVGGGIGAGPASAHGATLNPVSRAAACGPEGGVSVQSAACQAAAAANGGVPINDFENIRVANVAGKDRERIPDGKLCSAGIDRFKGLDLARADWPTTRVTSGAAFTFRYRVTIPHTGTFRFYVTKDGYRPTEPLRWNALQAQPFASITNPTAANGVYAMPGTLPTGKTGRHVIYVIWQNTGSPDTYYSCSDVTFSAAAGATGGGAGAAGAPAQPGAQRPGASAKAPSSAGASAGQPAPGGTSPDAGSGTGPGAGSSAGSGPATAGPTGSASPSGGAGLGNRIRLTAGDVPGGAAGLAAGGGALLLLILGAIFAVVSLRRRRPPHAARHTTRR